MPVSESSAMHQRRRRSAQKPQPDLIADQMSPKNTAQALAFSNRRLNVTGEIAVHELLGQSLNAIPATNYLLKFRIYGT
jgi:hypothetical protein